VDAYLRLSFGITTDSKPTTVVLAFDPPVAGYIAERQWHESQQLRELPAGRLRLTMTVTGIDEVRRWLLQHAGYVEVLRPSSLRAEVARLAGETARRNA
jgi:proteasome accessory factor B